MTGLATRRNIVKGAAWAAPAVAIATMAPAYAASPTSCRTAYLDWGTATTTKLTKGTVYTIRGAQPVYARVTYTETAASYAGTNTLGQKLNTSSYQLRVSKRAYGWVRNASGAGRVNYWDISTTGGTDDLILNQKAGSGATSVTIDFFRDTSLTQPVAVNNLQVPLDDISTQTSYDPSLRTGLSYQEMWSVVGRTTTGGAVSPSKAGFTNPYNGTSTEGRISGSGTAADPWHFPASLTNSTRNEVGGNLNTRFDVPVNSVTVTYGSSPEFSGPQGAGLGRLTMCV